MFWINGLERISKGPSHHLIRRIPIPLSQAGLRRVRALSIHNTVAALPSGKRSAHPHHSVPGSYQGSSSQRVTASNGRNRLKTVPLRPAFCLLRNRNAPP